MKLLVATLCHTQFLHSKVAEMLTKIAADKRVEAEFIFPQIVPVDEARNQINKYFLSKDFDYLLSTDNDTGCDKNPVDLCFLGKDVIYLPTPYIENGKVVLNTDGKGEGLVECSRGGTGCFILSRKAAVIPFSFSHVNGVLVGEDYGFSQKAKEAGFKLYCHKDYPCHHYKTVDLWKVR